MGIKFSRPQFLWLLILSVFFIFYILRKCRRAKKNAELFINKSNDEIAVYSPAQIYFKLFLKGICRCLALVCLVLALAGISWGSVSTPVQKSGNACAFVFDISYSMMANDAPSSLTRLQASVEYAKMLMEYMDGISVSCVLAKGDGIMAIPQTEDFASIYSLLDILSPSMMSAQGSSLGKGLEAALSSFPSSSARASTILLFTDGDETDTGLLPALDKCIRSGINVCIIGFGSERESEITAGDGITVVKTALREEKVKNICQEVNKKNQVGKDFSFIKNAHAKFIDASEVGSAVKVIYELRNIPHEKKLENVSSVLSSVNNQEQTLTVSYEMQSVDRHRIFIFLAVVLFVVSIFVSEFSIKSFRLLYSASMIIFVPLMFTSCSKNFNEAKTILESTWNWYQKDYNKAISGFTQAIQESEQNNDEITKQYALYGLSVTYLMQNEKNASLERLEQLSPDAPPKIRFASYYNAGLIAQREGDYDKAVDLFKLALLVSPEDVNAKINLELSQSQEIQKAVKSSKDMIPASENKETQSEVENAIFNRMRENDQKQWKNYNSSPKDTYVTDY